ALLGAQLFGLSGALLAVPVAATGMAMLEIYKRRYELSPQTEERVAALVAPGADRDEAAGSSPDAVHPRAGRRATAAPQAPAGPGGPQPVGPADPDHHGHADDGEHPRHERQGHADDAVARGIPLEDPGEEDDRPHRHRRGRDATGDGPRPQVPRRDAAMRQGP